MLEIVVSLQLHLVELVVGQLETPIVGFEVKVFGIGQKK